MAAERHHAHSYVEQEIGEYTAAIQQYERANRLYAALGNGAEQVRCHLEIARLYHQLEDLEAAHFYTDQAGALLSRLPQLDRQMMIELHLALARLTPDIGRICDSATHAQAALTLAEQLGDSQAQLEAMLLLAAAANQTGASQKCLRLTQLAGRRLTALQEDSPLWQLRIRNQEAHALWYLARFEEAVQVAATALQLADTMPPTKQRIYLRLLLGNLSCAQGHYSTACAYYDQADALIEPLHFPLYRVWIQAQRAWVAIRQGAPERGRPLLQQILTDCDHGQAMSFNVYLAVAYSLEQQWGAATQLLRQSEQFYGQSGDPLAVCAIQCHLAYIAICQQATTDAQRYTSAMLQWLAAHNLRYFPYWWHEQIVGTVLVFALQHAICPATVEQILLGPLQPRLDSQIRPLLHATALASGKLPGELRVLLDPVAQIDLAFADSPQAREVLSTLLQQGWLCPERFEELKARLITGKQRGQANATLLAVFSLYLQGWTRRRIAAQLAIAEATVRNYITLIYEIFPLPPATAGSHEQRRAALLAAVRQAGLIGEEKYRTFCPMKDG